MVKALDKKLLRELWLMKGQVITIGLVVACGIASYVSSASTYDSLVAARDAYYEAQRMPDVFARLQRAPQSVLRDVAALPGVAIVAERAVAEVTLDLPGLSQPASGRVISVPADGQPALSALLLRTGRWVEPGRADEVLALEPFARAHGLRPGDTVAVVFRGRREVLRIVGVVLSPEYVFPLLGGELFAEDERAGVFWMERSALGQRADMSGAFNEVVLKVEPRTDRRAVVEALDDLLEPYGATGALVRSQQPSDRFVTNELMQLEIQAQVVPVIFLAISAFLLNVVLSRLIQTQREQIATLKALGYTNREVGAHFLGLALVIVTIGAVLGTALGAWFGDGLVSVYSRYFRFPDLGLHLTPRTVLIGVAVSLFAAVVGTISVVRQVVRLPAAEGMRPEPPPVYHRSLIERWGITRLVPTPARMVLRDVERKPLRTIMTCLGIALAVMIMVIGLFWGDSVDHLIEVQFRLAQREDVTVTFLQTLDERAVRELEHLPGVLFAEPTRALPVRLRYGHRERQTALQGFEAGGELRRLFDAQGRAHGLPDRGLVLSAGVAERLGVRTGDSVIVDRVDENEEPRSAVVTAIVAEMVGDGAYMSLEALHRFAGEAPRADGALLATEAGVEAELLARLQRRPMVANAVTHRALMDYFEQEATAVMIVFMVVLSAFASVIAVGVVYNSARIALAERSRDLATLRVLGLTRREISRILLGELGGQVLLALPLGLLLGTAAAHGLTELMMDPELLRIPTIIGQRTYLWAVLVVLSAAAVSALLVRRRLDRLDLMAVLKARE